MKLRYLLIINLFGCLYAAQEKVVKLSLIDEALYNDPEDDPEELREAINAGADVLEKDSDGDTALHLFAKFGDAKGVQNLIDAVIDKYGYSDELYDLLTAENKLGDTAHKVAIERIAEGGITGWDIAVNEIYRTFHDSRLNKVKIERGKIDINSFIKLYPKQKAQVIKLLKEIIDEQEGITIKECLIDLPVDVTNIVKQYIGKKAVKPEILNHLKSLYQKLIQ